MQEEKALRNNSSEVLWISVPSSARVPPTTSEGQSAHFGLNPSKERERPGFHYSSACC